MSRVVASIIAKQAGRNTIRRRQGTLQRKSVKNEKVTGGRGNFLECTIRADRHAGPSSGSRKNIAAVLKSAQSARRSHSPQDMFSAYFAEPCFHCPAVTVRFVRFLQATNTRSSCLQSAAEHNQTLRVDN